MLKEVTLINCRPSYLGHKNMATELGGLENSIDLAGAGTWGV